MALHSRSDAERWLPQPACNVAPPAYRFSDSVSTPAGVDNGELRELHLRKSDDDRAPSGQDRNRRRRQERCGWTTSRPRPGESNWEHNFAVGAGAGGILTNDGRPQFRRLRSAMTKQVVTFSMSFGTSQSPTLSIAGRPAELFWCRHLRRRAAKPRLKCLACKVCSEVQRADHRFSTPERRLVDNRIYTGPRSGQFTVSNSVDYVREP